AQAAFMFMVVSVLGTAVIFARRNLRLGRGDPRGAFRVSTFVLVIDFLRWILAAHHLRDLTVEFQMLLAAVGFVLLRGVFVWVAYMAIEPYVRRRRPGLLIFWTRLPSGPVAHPMVGRDILIGLLVGGLRMVIFQIDNGLPWLFNVPGITPIPAARAALGAPGRLTGFILGQVYASVPRAL